MKSAGICIGASTISRVDVEKSNGKVKILNIISKIHDGNIKKTFEEILNNEDLKKIDSIAVTGRKFKNLVLLSAISEPEAVENAYMFLKDKYGSADYIASAGGETFTTYHMDSSNKIINIFTGNKCASGTGEFFLQQIKRMGITLEQAVNCQSTDEIYKVSGRCSVFCKSDCTHALNKGKEKGSIINGLCDMMASRILEHLGENTDKNVWVTGGCSKNNVMVNSLKSEINNLAIPNEAAYFEALGCAIWASENETRKINNMSSMFVDERKSFAVLPALSEAVSMVTFKDIKKCTAKENDKCILGLDVGSTTTKAVLIRVDDNAILASIYIKTLGDPIKAAKNCYMSIKKYVPCKINIVGLGVTGSGRQIAGLHALTDSVYNEISAHAQASVFFDSEVDTIFEIGGQDAKYTHILNGVPCDYAMNEACSAGTGSFLEESASEFLNIHYSDIEKIALKGQNPPDFNDQCAAFIGSDIKTAMQENIDTQDIVAGLVYSICKNYLNRVKGNRFVGSKIFMQGGVCYNKAVPVAMASLLKREIIVPPEPGLMGCFGVALMVKEKIEKGILDEKCFKLDTLINREVQYDKPFVCAGGNIKCDRKCNINMINIESTKYPFGGICGKYANIKTQGIDTKSNNYVNLREHMVYSEFSTEYIPMKTGGKKIGINRSLLVNTLFPLYYNFFTKLGFEVVLPKHTTLKNKSIVKKESSFCYPVNLAHEYFNELIKTDVDYIFLPHVKGMHVKNNIPISLTCPLVQGESYYMKTTFNTSKQILSPVLDFSEGYDKIPEKFIQVGEMLGIDRKLAFEAYEFAVEAQMMFNKRCKEYGKRFIEELEKTGERAIVLFGRPYNALVKDGNMGIPEKFASKGYKIIPYDFLPIEEEEPQQKMYWSMGQLILKAAKYVSKHKQLFGTFVTNFSCGPDSFVVSYFRDIMGMKPSLTLELDSHTADAGIDTRIDAFIDVMKNYESGQLQNNKILNLAENKRAEYDYKCRKIKLPDGRYISIRDKRVTLLIPSMGEGISRFTAAAFRHIGINAVALKEADDDILGIGRANSSCKECLPLILTVGSLLSYLQKNQDKEKVFVYFMPEAPDPCRFGQYHVYTEKLLKKLGINNVALLTLSSGNSYGGMGVKFKVKAWHATVIADIMEDIRSSLLVLAKDKSKAMEKYSEAFERIEYSVEHDNFRMLKKVLTEVTDELSKIPLNGRLEDAKKVAIVGEIYVRKDGFSRQNLVEKLAEKGIVSRIASVTEWVYYCDYLVKNNLSEDADLKDKAKVMVEGLVKVRSESQIKKILSKSGLVKYHMVDVNKVIENARELISPYLSGEAILTIGTAITEIIDDVEGVIAIGPFGCMPSKIAEAVLSGQLSKHKRRMSDKSIVKEVLKQYPNLPFFSIEVDGSAFPQVIDVKLEAFSLQVNRVNSTIKNIKSG